VDLSLTETQEVLRRTARDFLGSEFPSYLVRELEHTELGHSREIWAKLAEMAWTALPFSSEHEGLDSSLMDVAVVVEELAQAAALTPYVPTMLAGLAVQRSGSEDLKGRLLPGITDGSTVATIALVESSGSYEPEHINLTATRTGDAYVLNGTKLFVEYAAAADELVCVARTSSDGAATEGITLFVVPADTPGVEMTSLKVIGGDAQSEVVFSDVEISADRVLGVEGEGWETVEWLLNVARALSSMELVGIAQRALDMTVDYVGYREAFGRPIGTFQAVQHHCANMAMLLEGARWSTYEALWKLDEDLDAAYQCAAAKAAASTAGRDVTMMSHQLHGGIGYMEEFDLQLYSRRAKGLELRWGTPDQMFLKVADTLGV
jgi:alkylation response protein AidB-like acyl-CoA dehydrogenase